VVCKHAQGTKNGTRVGIVYGSPGVLSCQTVPAGALFKVYPVSSANSEPWLRLRCRYYDAEKSALYSGRGSTCSARGWPQAPCLAQVCCSVNVSCAIRRVTISVASALLEMGLGVNQKERRQTKQQRPAALKRHRLVVPRPADPPPAPAARTMTGASGSPITLHHHIVKLIIGLLWQTALPIGNLCGPKKAHIGNAKVCRPAPGTGSPRSG